MNYNPHNLQFQMREILTNDDYSVRLTINEIHFMKNMVIPNIKVLTDITEIFNCSNLFTNFKVNFNELPGTVLHIANTYNKNFTFESLGFLSNITRFTIDCLLTHQEEAFMIYEIDKLDCALDNCIKLLKFQLRENSPHSPSQKYHNSFFGFLNFCT